MLCPPLILASASPRRRELLRQAGVVVTVRPAQIPEPELPGETPVAHVRRLATEKAQAIAVEDPSELVLAADTTVTLDGRIFGKPADLDEAEAMIAALVGRTHRVITGVCLLRREPVARRLWHTVTEVTFRELGPAAIAAYVAEAQPLDKAGAYGIQDHRELLVADYRGSLSNVIGLPLEETLRHLAEFGA